MSQDSGWGQHELSLPQVTMDQHQILLSQVWDTIPDGIKGTLVPCVFLFQNQAYLQTAEQMCQYPVPKPKIHKLPGTTSPLVNLPSRECCYYSIPLGFTSFPATSVTQHSTYSQLSHANFVANPCRALPLNLTFSI